MYSHPPRCTGVRILYNPRRLCSGRYSKWVCGPRLPQPFRLAVPKRKWQTLHSSPQRNEHVYVHLYAALPGTRVMLLDTVQNRAT